MAADGLSQLRRQKAARKRTGPPPPKYKKPDETPRSEAEQDQGSGGGVPQGDHQRGDAGAVSPNAQAVAVAPSVVTGTPAAESRAEAAPVPEVKQPTTQEEVARTTEPSVPAQGKPAAAAVLPDPQGGAAASSEATQASPTAATGSVRSAVKRPATKDVATKDVATTAAKAPAHVSSEWDSYSPPSGSDVMVRAEEVLARRFFEREPLNASVPKVLEIGHRLQMLKVISRIDRIPPADLVSVGLDWFLRGGAQDLREIQPPWNQYRGHGTSAHIPRAEDVLQQRFIDREQLKASVPAELELGRRLTLYKLTNRGLRKVPIGDVVAVAMDRWLRLMGF